MATTIPVKVELEIDGAWADVTSDVRYEGRVTITRGGRDEATVVPAALAKLEFNNTDGRYSNRVPGGPYFRKLGRNTPIRISRTDLADPIRFVGEVPSWAPEWEESGTDVWVAVQAADIIRRLTQGAKALRSPMYRAYIATAPLVYLPLEDGRDATAAKPAAGGVAWTGTAAFGTATPPAGAAAALQTVYAPRPDPIPDQSTNLSATLALSSASTLWRIEIAAQVPGTVVTFDLAPVYLLEWGTAGTAATWLLYVDETTHTLHLRYTVGGVATNIDTGATARDGLWHHIRVDGEQVGADISLQVDVDDVQYVSTTIVGQTAGLPNMIEYFNFEDIDPALWPALCHLGIWDSHPVSLTAAALNGHAGETVAARMIRLCGEEGVTLTVAGDPDATAVMGPQQIGTLLTLLRHGESLDRGILHGTRDVLGLTYRTYRSLLNQVPIDLDYAAGHLWGRLRPTDDDQHLWNDVTVERINGSSARAVLESGSNSTQPPPDGVGAYDRGPLTVNAETDDQLDDIAEWIRHIGTWDEMRIPAIGVHLGDTEVGNDQDLLDAVTSRETGDEAQVANLPVWLPPDLGRFQVRGHTEMIDSCVHTLAWNTVPAWPYEVWQLETGGSTLVAAVNSSATSLKLATSLGPDWSTTREPYHIQIAGEAMTVTAMVTDTPAFVAAGTVAHANNASVAPGLPAGMAAGGSMFCLAAIRNSGTGTVNTPAGWSKLIDFGNVAVLHRYYVSGDSAPTVTFTGGAANADTSARIVGFSGLSKEFASGTRLVPAAYTQLNGSAQDVAYPASAVKRANSVGMIFTWKQDDGTHAPPGSYTEMIDDLTTTGSDQSIAGYYLLNAVAASVAGSVVVTGGAAAISRAIVAAFRPTQTATVTRSINGVVGSIAAGEAVSGWRLGVIAL